MQPCIAAFGNAALLRAVMDRKLYPGKRQQAAAFQDPEALDMSYLESWCAIHGTTDRLANILASLPPL